MPIKIDEANLSKFMFSKKATEIDEIFTVDLIICSKISVKLTLKISSIFVAFLENTNFDNYSSKKLVMKKCNKIFYGYQIEKLFFTGSIVTKTTISGLFCHLPYFQDHSKIDAFKMRPGTKIY